MPRFTILVALLIGCGEVTPAPSQATPQSTATPAEQSRAEILAEFNSTEEHWATMKEIGDRMLGLEYEIDDKGTKLDARFVTGHITAHAFHIHTPDAAPYKMEWRLSGLGAEGANDVPVSFLVTRIEGPFTHDVAIAAVKEFQRAAGNTLDLNSVKATMKDAEAKFAEERKKPTEDSWMIESKIVKEGDYAYRVDIGEWIAEEYTLEDGMCKVSVYFVYLPPGKKVDLKKVMLGGF